MARRIAEKIGVKYNSIDNAVKKSDIVMVSVPIGKTYEVCKVVAKSLKRNTLLIDVASVKSGIADRLQKELPPTVKYVSIHPLFGPNIRSLRNRTVVVIKGRNRRSEQEIAKYFREKGSIVEFLSVEEHDRAMAMLQAVHHFALLSLHEAIQSRKEWVKNLDKLAPESFKLTWKTIGRISLNLDMVKDIQRYNPYAKEARFIYSRVVSSLLKKLER